jgi:hypothetical protein
MLKNEVLKPLLHLKSIQLALNCTVFYRLFKMKRVLKLDFITYLSFKTKFHLPAEEILG